MVTSSGRLNSVIHNVKDDPGETKNLANEQPELLKKLQKQWQEYADGVITHTPDYPITICKYRQT